MNNLTYIINENLNTPEWLDDVIDQIEKRYKRILIITSIPQDELLNPIRNTHFNSRPKYFYEISDGELEFIIFPSEKHIRYQTLENKFAGILTKTARISWLQWLQTIADATKNDEKIITRFYYGKNITKWLGKIPEGVTVFKSS